MYQFFLKPLTDYVIGFLATLISLPLILCLAVLVTLESPGNPFFIHWRVGRGGRLFKMYKLRSMRVHTPSPESYATHRDDPRITRIGRLIRRTSLDELPQLWNILLGDMSLIGPRPDVMAQKELYSNSNWENRTSVKPGITGLAQCTLRSEATMEQRTELDLDYVKNVSLKLDVEILLRTIGMVILSKKSN